MHLGLIGYGSITSELLGLIAPLPIDRISILVRPGREGDARTRLSAAPPEVARKAEVLADGEAFLAARPDLVVEAAGHEAAATHGPAVLGAGIDLVLVSVGALTDDALHERLVAAARDGGARLILPAGAIGGIDIVAALAPAGDMVLRYFGAKPPAAWAGTPAAGLADLGGLDEPVEIFRGTAREAAIAFPRNANVAATLALAGGGLDATQVVLTADPAAQGNVHRYELTSPTASLSVEIANRPSAGNAKTSLTTVYSVLREIRNHLGPVSI